MTAPTGTALVGTGAIATSHATAITATDGFTLSAVVSRSLAKAEDFVGGLETPGARAATLDEVLSDEAIGLVVVATPTESHVPIGARALAAGRHVLIEKPLDVDLMRALKFARASERARQRGVLAAAVSQHRFDPSAEFLREAIQAGRLGAITSAVASISWWRSQRYYDRAGWRGTWAGEGGGALVNQGIHSLDLLVWLLGRPRRVTATSRTLAHQRIEVEDTVAAILEFDSGALAVLHVTTAAYPGLTTRLQVMGTSGSVLIENDELAYVHVDDGTPVSDMGLTGQGNQLVEFGASDASQVEPTLNAEGLGRQYHDLATAIRSGTRPRVSVQDAVSTLAVVHAVYRSATRGQPVLLDDVLADTTPGPYRVGRLT